MRRAGWMRAALVAATVAVSLGCAQPPLGPRPRFEDKIDKDTHIGLPALPDQSHGAVQTKG
jgi:hypothetical protein